VIACGRCGLALVPGIEEEADKWRTADGGRYFCQASDDGMHHAVQALPDPRVGREGLTFVVSVASINAAPGAPLLASYWARARPGEGLSAWRERERTERSVAYVQKQLARLGGVGGAAPDCPLCRGSGVVWGDAVLVYCPNNEQQASTPREEGNHA